jgi:hypothetical protein
MAQSYYRSSSATSIVLGLPSISLWKQSESAILLLDVLLIKKENTLATKVYRKPTHSDQYLNFKSNHPPHVERGLILGLHNRASTICHKQQALFTEISSLSLDHQLSGYPQGFIDSVINSKGSSHLNKEEEPLGSMYIPCVKGISEKFKRIWN